MDLDHLSKVILASISIRNLKKWEGGQNKWVYDVFCPIDIVLIYTAQTLNNLKWKQKGKSDRG